MTMTHDEHRRCHLELHRALAQLVADYIAQHPDEREFTTMPLNRLIEWSYQQTIEPDHQP